MDWQYSWGTWFALQTLGLTVLMIPRLQSFWFARLCFVGAAGMLFVNSIWWAVNTNYPLALRVLIVGTVSALAAVALAESLRWVAHTEVQAAPAPSSAGKPSGEASAPQGLHVQTGGQGAGAITNTGPVYNAPVTIQQPPHKPEHTTTPPQNIDNRGGLFIGGSNTGTATVNNYGPPQRRLDDDTRSKILSRIPKTQKIAITYYGGNGESEVFAEEIAKFLKLSGYEVENTGAGLGWSQTPHGTIITTDLEGGTRTEIIVGLNP